VQRARKIWCTLWSEGVGQQELWLIYHQYEAAIALDHNHARAYLHLGQTLMFLGQPEAGAPHIEKAIRLNPYDPNIGTAYWALGTSYLLVGQLNEALYVHKKARAANSRLWDMQIRVGPTVPRRNRA
jgi:tetratricopeptide (TPR) repeat protein